MECNFICIFCLYETKWIFAYEHHKKKHKNKNLRFNCNNGLPKYYCNQCGYKTHEKYIIHNHMTIHPRKNETNRWYKFDYDSLITYRLKRHTLSKCKSNLKCSDCDFKGQCDLPPINKSHEKDGLSKKKFESQNSCRKENSNNNNCDQSSIVISSDDQDEDSFLENSELLLKYNNRQEENIFKDCEKIDDSPVKNPRQRKPDFCYFCKDPVKNYARHLRRNHANEKEVLEIFMAPIKSKERRTLFDRLRRKGNYLAANGECFKVVRQPFIKNRDVLPCDNCLGFFSSKLLSRHRKRCLKANSTNVINQPENQSELILDKRKDNMINDEVVSDVQTDKVPLTNEDITESQSVSSAVKIKKGNCRQLVPWTEKQKSEAKTFFNTHIKNKQPPKKNEIEELRSKTGNLYFNKSWPQIKVFIQNIYNKK